MKKVNVEIKLYQFNELSEEAKEKAIDEHRDFLLSTMSERDFISGDPEHDTKEELKEMYNTEYDYILYNNDAVIENIEANEYYFFTSGELANTVTYTNTGITEFNFCDMSYQVN